MRLLMAIAACLTLAGCGGDDAASSVAGTAAAEPSAVTVPSDGGDQSAKAQARSLLEGLMPEIEAFMLHSLGIDKDGGRWRGGAEQVAQDKQRLIEAVAEVRAEARTIGDAALRTQVIGVTDAFDRWLELELDKPPRPQGRTRQQREKNLWRQWAREMRTMDVAARRYDNALDASGAPKDRRFRLSGRPR